MTHHAHAAERRFIKLGMLLALASCSTQANCQAVSCAAGGVTVDFAHFVAATPAATVTLCVVNTEDAPCSKPISLSLGIKGVVFVPLGLPKTARLSIELANQSRTILVATAGEVQIMKGRCCPGRAVLTLDSQGEAQADNTPFFQR